MSFGSWLGNQIDIVGFLKGLFNRIYAFLFSDEIAQQAADEKAAKAAEQQQKAAAAEDQKQVAAIEVQKQAVNNQIAVEQKRQASDEAMMQKVKDDLDKKVDAIKQRPDDDVLRDDF